MSLYTATLQKIEKKRRKDEKMTTGKKLKDYFTKGLQLHECYEEDWNIMSDIFKDYNLPMGEHGPLITIIQREYVKAVDDIVKQIKDNENIIRIASNGMGLIMDPQKQQEIVEHKLFKVMLAAAPIWCLYKELGHFETMMKNGNGMEFLEELLRVNGTIKEKFMDIQSIVKHQLQQESS